MSNFTFRSLESAPVNSSSKKDDILVTNILSTEKEFQKNLLLKILLLKNVRSNIEIDEIKSKSVFEVLKGPFLYGFVRKNNLKTYKSLNYSTLLIRSFVSFFKKFSLKSEVQISEVPFYKEVKFNKENGTTFEVECKFGDSLYYLDITNLSNTNLDFTILDQRIHLYISNDGIGEFFIGSPSVRIFDEMIFIIEKFSIDLFLSFTRSQRATYITKIFNYNHLGYVDFPIKNTSYQNFIKIKEYFDKGKTIIINNNIVISSSKSKEVVIKNAEFIGKELFI